MLKSEADNLHRWTEENSRFTGEPDETGKYPDSSILYVNAVELERKINSMTDDTDPRIEVVERIRKVLDNDKDKRGYGHTFTELRNIEAEIKQEAGDA
jgi:hypothetical protein